MRAAVVTAFLVTLTVGSASAGSLSIAPLSVDFDAERRSIVIEIANRGEMDMSMQVEAMTWSQPAGEPVYEPTDELIAVPPIFSLAPGETQLVRVGIIVAPPTDIERSYRLFFTEIPSPVLSSDRGSGLLMRMRVGLPVFDQPLMVAESALEIVGVEPVDGQLRVSLHNPGNAHVRVSQLLTIGADIEEQHKTPGYVLAGSRRDFLITMPIDFEIGRVRAVADVAGVRDYEIAPELQSLP